MSIKLTPDGISPFTGKTSLIFEHDEILQDIKILDPDTGWFTFTKSQCSEKTYKEIYKLKDRKIYYYDSKTGLVWYPDQQVFFIGDDTIILTPDLLKVEDILTAEWLVCEAIQDPKIDTAFNPNFDNILKTGTYDDCLNYCFKRRNDFDNEQD